MKGIALPLPENKLCTVCQFYYRWAISRRATAVSIKYALKQTAVKCFTKLCCLKADKSLKTVGDVRRQIILEYTLTVTY